MHSFAIQKSDGGLQVTLDVVVQELGENRQEPEDIAGVHTHMLQEANMALNIVEREQQNRARCTHGGDVLQADFGGAQVFEKLQSLFKERGSAAEDARGAVEDSGGQVKRPFTAMEDIK